MDEYETEWIETLRKAREFLDQASASPPVPALPATVLKVMKKFSEVDWAELPSTQPNPIDFLRRKGVRVFLRIDSNAFAVRRHSISAPPLSLPKVGYHLDIEFLGLDNRALSQLAVSGEAKVSEFTGAALQLVEGTGAETPILLEVPCVRCEVHSIRKVSDALPGRMPASGRLDSGEFTESLTIELGDVWLESSAIDEVRDSDLLHGQLVDYPFDHRLRFPAVFWMFQAAYKCSKPNGLEDDVEKIANWLRNVDPMAFENSGCTKVAAKFVRLRLRRGVGRPPEDGPKSSEAFDIASMASYYKGNLEDISKPFLSHGITTLLAVTQWWATVTNDTPSEPAQTLYGELMAHRFSEGEARALTRLITGTRIR